jgi:hypothetical protein
VHITTKEHPDEMAAIMPAPSPVVLFGNSVVVVLPFSSVVEEDGSCGVLVGPLVLVVDVTVIDFVVVNVVASLVVWVKLHQRSSQEAKSVMEVEFHNQVGIVKIPQQITQRGCKPENAS